MPKDDLKRARAEIDKLREQINRHNHFYYVLDNPELTAQLRERQRSPLRKSLIFSPVLLAAVSRRQSRQTGPI